MMRPWIFIGMFPGMFLGMFLAGGSLAEWHTAFSRRSETWFAEPVDGRSKSRHCVLAKVAANSPKRSSGTTPKPEKQ
jgi:hypothetical protein